jgi:type IV pilus assembly protein PilC
MPRFAYKAYTKSGKLAEGVMEAAAEREVLLFLRRQDLKVRIIEKQAEPLFGFLSGLKRTKVTPQDVMRFTSMFATLVNAGIPMSSCVRTLQEQSDNPAFKDILQNVMQEIEGGLDLSEALGKHPAVFDRMYVDLVRAGEVGGVLHEVLKRLAAYTEKAERFRRRIKGALTYPAVVTVIAILIVWVILQFVVPQFAETFASAGKSLPLPTRILMAASDFVRFYYYIFFLGVAAIYAGFRVGMRDPKFQRTIDGLVLKIPVFGDLLMKSAICRFARTLAMLLVSGIPIIQSLEIVSRVTGNRMISEALLAVVESISSGSNVADPMKRSGVFAPIVVQMISVGESTGNLAGMLSKIADFYEDEVEVVMESLSTLIEPIMIVFLGVVLGFVIIALFLPILSRSGVHRV